MDPSGLGSGEEEEEEEEEEEDSGNNGHLVAFLGWTQRRDLWPWHVRPSLFMFHLLFCLVSDTWAVGRRFSLRFRLWRHRHSISAPVPGCNWRHLASPGVAWSIPDADSAPWVDVVNVFNQVLVPDFLENVRRDIIGCKQLAALGRNSAPSHPSGRSWEELEGCGWMRWEEGGWCAVGGAVVKQLKVEVVSAVNDETTATPATPATPPSKTTPTGRPDECN